jgi:hypothetical protein
VTKLWSVRCAMVTVAVAVFHARSLDGVFWSRSSSGHGIPKGHDFPWAEVGSEASVRGLTLLFFVVVVVVFCCCGSPLGFMVQTPPTVSPFSQNNRVQPAWTRLVPPSNRSTSNHGNLGDHCLGSSCSRQRCHLERSVLREERIEETEVDSSSQPGQGEGGSS